MSEQFAFSFAVTPGSASEIVAPAVFETTEPAMASVTEPSQDSARRTRKTRISRLDDLAPPASADRPNTVQGAVAWLEERLGDADPEFKAIKGAVVTVAKVIRRTEDRNRALKDDLPADPVRLRTLLAGALPAGLGISMSRWANAKSLLTNLLIASGWVSPDARPRLPLSGPWEHLMRLVPGSALSLAIRPFLRFCERRGVLPQDIAADDLLAYEAWLTYETINLFPRQAVRRVQCSWRRLARAYPAWPQQDVTTPSRFVRRALTSADLPASFEADVLAFMAALRDPDPLDPAAGRQMAENSVQHTRRNLLRAATCLVRTGIPVESITSISVLVEPASFRAILLVLFEEGKPRLAAAGETARWTKVADSIATTLLNASRRWVKVSPEVLEQLQGTRKMVVPRRGGLSKQVQDRLADLSTDDDREHLHKLPWDAFEQADKMLRAKHFWRASKLHETALALAIILTQPLRLGDLAHLDTEQHFVRDGRGRLAQVAIRAAKNGVQIRFEVQPELAVRIERHLSKFRPHLRGHADTTALFPGENGRPRRAGTLGQHLRHLVERQLGKRFHPHLARHLAVDIIAERTDGNLRPAQKLLGHRAISTTEFIYGSRSTLAANRTYQDFLRDQSDRVAAKASRKPSPPKPRNCTR